MNIWLPLQKSALEKTERRVKTYEKPQQNLLENEKLYWCVYVVLHLHWKAYYR